MLKFIQIAVSICISICSCFLCTAGASPNIVKIGVIVPLSGDMAVHGVEIQRAMRLAKKRSTETAYDYQLIFEDNRLEGAKSITAAKRLIDVESVDVIVTLWPPTAEVVLPLTEKNNILHYTISWDPELARRNRLLLSHQAMVDAIARETIHLIKEKGIKRPAFLHMEETGFNKGASFIRKIAGELKIELAADETFSPEERDARSLLARVERKQPDGYLIWAVMPSIDVVIRRIREINSAVKITGYLDYAQDLSLLEGAEYISEMYARKDFIEAYRAAYGEVPRSKGANAYDIFNLISWAFDSSPAKKLSAKQIKDKLLQVRNREGAVGIFSIDSDGNSTYQPVWRKIEEGKRLLVKVPKFVKKDG